LKIYPDVWRDIFRIGMPTAGQITLEVGAFSLAGVFAGSLGPLMASAHYVVLRIATTTFMLPLGLGAAATVRVGNLVGAGDGKGAKRAGNVAIVLAAVVMLGCAVILFAAPSPIIGIFSKDPDVIRAALSILILAGMFQLFDGVQVSATGALRGLGKTRPAMIANLIGHYPIGLALGSLLCFGAGMGIVGLWIGFLVGLIFVASTLAGIWIRTEIK
jgi:multidrug resistance protein, MATE family